MKKRSPTNCPIVFSLDIFGDAWSLVILRYILFDGKSHFREFLASPEKIASNILSNRLELFVANGLVTKQEDPANKSANIYIPTQKSLELLPVLIEISRWGVKYNPNIDPNWDLIPKLQTDPEGLQRDILKNFTTQT